jgi:outer membrane protein OmpA-like peptidoglycan-associated protein
MSPRKIALIAGLLTAISASAASGDGRDRENFGQAPSAKEVEGFLFPEAACENPNYTCLVPIPRPTKERSIPVAVRFRTGSAELTPQAEAQLEGIGKVLAARGSKLQPGEIVVEGHTDARGSAEYNQKLSEQRAESVAKHLVTTYGVSPSALRSVGRGKDHPIENRPDSEANRRVEMVRKPI